MPHPDWKPTSLHTEANPHFTRDEWLNGHLISGSVVRGTDGNVFVTVNTLLDCDPDTAQDVADRLLEVLRDEVKIVAHDTAPAPTADTATTPDAATT